MAGFKSKPTDGMSVAINEASAYERLRTELKQSPRTWLITGVAGFIGSNLLEALLMLDQRVVGLDNFATGHQRNLDEVQSLVTPTQWNNFHFLNGDIRNLDDCRHAMVFPARTSPCSSIAVEYVLHQAALGSVPRSLADPITTNSTNITGFLNILVAARDARVKSVTYAASSSTYGDHPGLPKVEHTIGSPLSPYAVTKYVNELYSDVFSRCFGLQSIGLRYFNVFGKRQDPEGAYAAVIPKWTAAVLRGESVFINGDGETSRDFCYINNAVQANLLAALCNDPAARGQVYNVAVSERTSLNELFKLLLKHIRVERACVDVEPVYRDFRPGDVRHSQADISKAQNLLGYSPTHTLESGVAEAMPWYVALLDSQNT